MIKTYSVKSDFVNSRLDRWYKKNICNVPQSLLEKNLRKGKIKVNNKKEKSSYKLKIDDKIIIYNFFPKIEHKKKYLEKYMPRKDELTHSSKMIIENNEDFVIINKPATLNPTISTLILLIPKGQKVSFAGSPIISSTCFGSRKFPCK